MTLHMIFPPELCVLLTHSMSSTLTHMGMHMIVLKVCWQQYAILGSDLNDTMSKMSIYIVMVKIRKNM